ncbi:malate dehydrogenase [Phaffia rhodozyma]|uniref:Malate dehydrogenase n=1 Tax=Phaffia rhodozyma TaxID=264483 RepID=A0A0F7STL3_PHARH|nr:malate dehydrogenase [Phaffia rhodozyma]
MFALKKSLSAARSFSTTPANLTKVAVLGAAGGIGQPLSLLLKLNPNVTELSLYDIRGAPGVGADIGHINTNSTVKGYPQEQLKEALAGAEIVLIPAGVPRKPGMTRDDLFNTNASIVRDLTKAIAETSPKAFIGIISNPVNSTVPIAAEVLKAAGVYDPKRLFGVTTLDVVRASRFVSEIQGSNPKDIDITVVGGHSGPTIVPLFSQTEGSKSISGEAYKALVNRTQFGGDEVVKAKDGAGSATLSMAQAAAVFAEALMKAIKGEKNIVIPTFVESPIMKNEGLDFFSTNVELGPDGVAEIHGLGELSSEEQELLKACVPELAKNIKKGVDFVKGA